MKLSKLLQNCVSTASSTIDFSPFVQSALSILLTSPPHVKGKHIRWTTFEIVWCLNQVFSFEVSWLLDGFIFHVVVLRS